MSETDLPKYWKLTEDQKRVFSACFVLFCNHSLEPDVVSAAFDRGLRAAAAFQKELTRRGGTP